MNWVIYNLAEPELCWSNTDGWVEEGYDSFTDEEKQTMTLPIGGAWESVPWIIQG